MNLFTANSHLVCVTCFLNLTQGVLAFEWDCPISKPTEKMFCFLHKHVTLFCFWFMFGLVFNQIVSVSAQKHS